MNDRQDARLPEQFASAKDTGSLAARLTRARAQARLFGGTAPAVKVGRFKLIEALGAGGMGSVFAAHDPKLDREVALKFLHAPEGVGATALRGHLRREARALAAVSHPNVVEVHTIEEADGHVFIAMERVRGQTLRAWLQAKPGRPRIVTLFASIADALDAAHRADVAHGDFKPENVMVSADDTPRILDFGLANTVANLRARSVAGPADTVAEAGSSGGTPAYAAPEQLHGAPRDPRSDQFAFFVALYESLTGHLPAQSLTAPRAEPLSPLPVRLRRLIDRGLRRDPAARWGSMGEVRDRLSRRPRRSWMVVAGLLAVGGAGLLVPTRAPDRCDPSGGGLARLWDDDRRTRIQRAFVATELPYAADAFARASTEIDTWASQWREQYADACNADAEIPRERVDIAIACLNASRYAMESLLAQWEVADAAALSNADTAVRGLDAPAGCTITGDTREPLPDRVVRILAEAKAYRATGRYAEGIKDLTEAGPVVDAAGPAAHVEYLYRLGELLMHDGQYDAAEERLSRCYHLAGELGDDYTAGSAGIYLTVLVGERLVRPEEGLRWGRHARAALERAGADADAMAALNNSIGGVLYRAGDFDAALARFEDADAQWSEAWGADAPEVAVAADNVAATLAALARFDEALEQFSRSLQIRQTHYGEQHPDVATSLHNRATTLNRMGRYDEARPLVARATEIRKTVLGDDHPHYAESLGVLGDAQSGLGDVDAAERTYAEGARVTAIALGDNHPATAIPLVSLGNIAFYRDDPATARAYYLRGLAIYDRAYGEGNIRTARTVLNIAATYGVEHKLEESAAYYRKGLKITEEALGATHPQVGLALKGLGSVQRLAGESAAAVATLERALTLLEAGQAGPQSVADCQATLAQALWDAGQQRQRARELAEQAREAFVELGAPAAGDLEELEAWLEGLRGEHPRQAQVESRTHDP